MSITVYLAGGISPAQYDWRSGIVYDFATHLEGRFWPHYDPPRPVEAMNQDDPDEWAQWEPRPTRLPGVSVNGPFFIEGEGHDGMHGPGTHGMANSYEEEWRSDSVRRRDRKVVSMCITALEQADMVFAWIDRLDVHGTLFELGWARAIGKPVYVANAIPSSDPDVIESVGQDYGDAQRQLWFLMTACKSRFVNAEEESPLDALRTAVKNYLAS